MTTTTATKRETYVRPSNGRHAVVITLEQVEPAFYTGWHGRLEAAKSDGEAMVKLLKRAGFAPTELTNAGATLDSVAAALAALANEATSGDHVVVYFSGHGATLPDRNYDELGVLHDGAWCLHDGMYVDDELIEALTKFKPGVRVVVITDSCFTGTVVRNDAQRAIQIGSLGSKLAPVDIGQRVYEAQKSFYDPILTRPVADPDDANAALLVLSACDKGELALVNDSGASVFTAAIVSVWNDGRFTGTYAELFDRVSEKVTKSVPFQHPVQAQAGARQPNLLDEPPFGGAVENPDPRDPPLLADAAVPRNRPNPRGPRVVDSDVSPSVRETPPAPPT